MESCCKRGLALWGAGVGARMTCMKVRNVIGVALVLGSLACLGCEKPLFPENQPRSPYDRYLNLRGQSRPMHQQNAYGGDEPALRDRLKPLGEP